MANPLKVSGRSTLWLLVETVLPCGVGAVAGVLLGFGGSLLAARVQGQTTDGTWQVVVLAIALVVAVVGLLIIWPVVKKMGTAESIPWADAAPRASRASKEAPPRAAASPAPSGDQPLKLYAALGAVVAAVVAFSVFGAIKGPDTAPIDILGTWTTTAPKYANRGFMIAPDSIYFQTGPKAHERTAHAIRKIDESERAGVKSFTIKYLNGESEYEMSFDVSTTPPEQLRLRNQRGIAWQRISG